MIAANTVRENFVAQNKKKWSRSWIPSGKQGVFLIKFIFQEDWIKKTTKKRKKMKKLLLIMGLCSLAKLEAVNVQMAFTNINVPTDFEISVGTVNTFTALKKDIQYRFFSQGEKGESVVLLFPIMGTNDKESFFEYKTYLSEAAFVKDMTDIYDGKVTSLINLDKSSWTEGSGTSGNPKAAGDIRLDTKITVPDRAGFFGAVVIRPRYARYHDFYTIVFYKK